MIRFACGTCKERLVVPVHHAGRRGKCPNCGTVNRVPRTSEFPATEPATAVAPATPAQDPRASDQPAEESPQVASPEHAAPKPDEDPSEVPARLVEVDPF